MHILKRIEDRWILFLKKFCYVNLFSSIQGYFAKKHATVNMYEIYHIFWANHKQSQAQGSSEAKGSTQYTLPHRKDFCSLWKIFKKNPHSHQK